MSDVWESGKLCKHCVSILIEGLESMVKDPEVKECWAVNLELIDEAAATLRVFLNG